MARRVLIVALLVLALAAWSEAAPAGALEKGDTDCDGEITTADGIEVLKYKAKLSVGASCLQLADADCDQVVDQIDALAIFKYLAIPTISPSPCAGIGTMPVNGQVYADTEYIFGVGDGVVPRDVVPLSQANFIVGDQGGGPANEEVNTTLRVIVSFPVGAIEGAIENATLSLAVTETRRDQNPDPGFIDGNAPFDNPQIGDLQVLNVADPGEPTPDDFNAASIGNDPGVLVANGAEGPAFYLTIDVKTALQQAIDEQRDVLAFRLQMSIPTDNDDLNDTWGFWSSNTRFLDRKPTVSYTLD